MEEVQVDLETKIVAVFYDPQQASEQDIKAALEAGGDRVLPEDQKR